MKRFLHNTRRKAFTLIELLLVLAIIAVLTAVGFIAFVYLRNATLVGNSAKSIKTAIRDVQDKALTISINNDNESSQSYKTNVRWVYGYSLEYNAGTQSFDEWKIIDTTSGFIPSDATRTQAVRNSWKSGNSCNGGTLPNFVTCSVDKSIAMEAPVTVSVNMCNIFFTTVNAIPTLKGGAANCNVNINLSGTKIYVSYDKGAILDSQVIGDIKICQQLSGNNVCP